MGAMLQNKRSKRSVVYTIMVQLNLWNIMIVFIKCIFFTVLKDYKKKKKACEVTILGWLAKLGW